VRRRDRDTSALALASLVSGVLAYVVFALTTRALGSADAAPVSVLWSFWSLAAAAVTFPLQHWITQSVAAHGGFGAARRVLPRVLRVVVVATAVAGLGAWLLRDVLFGRDNPVFPLLVATLTAGSALMGVVRGGLAARLRFRDLAVTMLAENGVRCTGVVVLLGAGVEEPSAYAACIAAGHLTALAWIGALRFPDTGAEALPGSAMGVLTGASTGQLLAQVVLTSGPVVLALHGGAPAEVTALFVGLAVYRAPYILGLGLVSQLTGWLTVLVVEGRDRELQQVRVRLVGATLAAALAAAAVGLWLGPPLVRFVFGADIALDATTSCILAVGSALAVANLVASIIVIAQRRSLASGLAWVVGLTLAAPVLVVDLDELTRIAVAFAVAEAVAFVVLVGASRRRG